MDDATMTLIEKADLIIDSNGNIIKNKYGATTCKKEYNYGPVVAEGFFKLQKEIDKLKEDNEDLQKQVEYWKKRYQKKIFAND